MALCAVVLYLALVAATRWMGHRQVGMLAAVLEPDGTESRPGTALASPDRLRAPAAHDSFTSKNPTQPSCVNSVWWAWNMNMPGCEKENSRMPRSPWHCMTVSL